MPICRNAALPGPVVASQHCQAGGEQLHTATALMQPITRGSSLRLQTELRSLGLEQNGWTGVLVGHSQCMYTMYIHRYTYLGGILAVITL